MAHHEIVIAGFGGQGLLFIGKVLAYAGLIEQRQLSWLPSYGPEMRGGTANCSHHCGGDRNSQVPPAYGRRAAHGCRRQRYGS